jgi:DNA topoisomerase VI subunit B
VNDFANSDLFGAVYPAKSVPLKSRILQSDPEFTRNDWSIYISNLPQRAGVPLAKIRALVLKEMVDNALDEMDRVGRPGAVTLTKEGDHTYTITDQGRGFDDSPEELAHRFSIAKGMVSSKQWRKPTRGCVGNGLRVIVGAVVSGGGRIIVRTRNQKVTLRPRLDGTTAVDNVMPIHWPVGASITIEIDRKFPGSNDSLEWAQQAIALGRQSGPAFNRKPSPAWYDTDHLALNMLAAIGPARTLTWFVSQLDRCSSREIGQRVTAKFGKGRLCRDVNKEEAAQLLQLLQWLGGSALKPRQLGLMGADAWIHEQLTDGYVHEEGSFVTGRSEPHATIPFLVEVWAATCETPDLRDDDNVYPVEVVSSGFTINRSPAIVDSRCYRNGRSRSANLWLGSESIRLDIPQGAFAFAVNITTPFVPILGDNKRPYLGAFCEQIKHAVERAIKRVARNNPPVLVASRKDNGEADEEDDAEKPERIFQRSAILRVLPQAIERSGEGGYEFSQRSLYYRVRILIKAIITAEPTYNYFCSVLTDYENDNGEIEKLIRDTRGVYVEPHGGQLTQMGTVTVAAYSRPPWSYSNILFLEKEDLVSALRQSGFLDRWDCFALSSKGFSSRAARDLIDKIGASGKEEPTKFFCVHDADASGSLISQTLTRATRARAARLVKVIDLGFFPWVALSEGLLRERAERKSNKRRPVADYIKARDQANNASGNPNNEPNWEAWLQDWRVELNAMTTAEFIEWMITQFKNHGAAKVIPSEQVALESVSQSIEANLSSAASAEVKEERREELEELQQQLADLENEIAEEAANRTKERLKEIKLPSGPQVVEKIKAWLKRDAQLHWRGSIDAVASIFIEQS